MSRSKDNGDVETYFKKRPRRNNLNTAIEMSNKLQERMYQEKLVHIADAIYSLRSKITDEKADGIAKEDIRNQLTEIAEFALKEIKI